MTAAGTLIALRYAIVIDHPSLRVLLAVATCAGLLITAMKAFGLWLRFRDGDIADAS